jgi:glycosyltransferase involved in cell wall biosynthesis
MEKVSKISFIVPLYNKANFIEECVRSMHDQTWGGEIEVVVWDDGSTDGSLEQALWLKEEGLIKFLGTGENGGTAYATNRAMELATGDVIFYCGADDVCHHERVQRQLDCLEQWKADVCDTYIMYFGDDTRTRANLKPYLYEEKIKMARSGRNPMNGGTMAWKRSVYEKMLQNDGYFFNERLRHAEDIEAAYRMVRSFKCVGCPQILYMARRNEDNKTAWAHNGGNIPPRRVADLAIIEKVRESMFGAKERKRGFF